MARVRLVVHVDPDVAQRLASIAADESTSIDAWIEEAVRRDGHSRVKEPRSPKERVYLARGISTLPDASKPKGITDPPRLHGNTGTVADAVIEDRR